MGERIKDISKFNFGNAEVHIELNKAYGTDYKYDVHMQTDKTQLFMKDGDFLKFAAAIKKARIELERGKNVKSCGKIVN